MKFIKILCIVLIFSTQAFAKMAHTFEGVNITRLVEWLDLNIKTLKAPTTVYSWSARADLANFDASQVAARSSEVFWDSFGPRSSAASMLGSGLYAAVDPVVSWRFSGRGADWLLLEMHLPAGLKILGPFDGELGTTLTAKDLEPAVKAFQCPAISTDYGLALLWNGGNRVTQHCRSLIKHIFTEVLHVDAILYGYYNAKFMTCKRSERDSFAFVMTSSYWMNGDTVHSYSAKKLNDFEDRRRIQSLFLKSYLEKHPDPKTKQVVRGLTTLSAKNLSPKVTAQFPKGLLWPDLEGQPVTSDLDTWIYENSLGCSDALPF